MLIIPAIDLRGGKVVRLFQGKFNQEKVYSADPVKVAKHWAKQGAKLLHIVDLDGASSGTPKSTEVLKKIIDEVGIGVEFGGGVRSLETISRLLRLGVMRVVLGTRALDAKFLKIAWKKFKDQVIVSIDAKSGKVSTCGWRHTESKTALAFAKEIKAIGFKQLIYTDISKDGTLTGPNIAGIKELIKKAQINIIASGGVTTLKDIVKLNSLKKQGVSGVIVGKALYEGKFTLAQALRVAPV